MTDRYAFRLVGCIFAGAAAVMLGVAAWLARGQLAVIKTWPLAHATVAKSGVVHFTRREMDRRADTALYKTEVEFLYRVGGREYRTSSQSDYASSSFAEMRRQADTFRQGAVYPIRYNPRNPYDIRHTAGYTAAFFMGAMIFGGLGLVFALVGTVLLKVADRMKVLACRACGKPIERFHKFCPFCAAPRAPAP